MAVTSINIYRVSNNMRTLSLLESLRSNTLKLFLEQNRLASGNRFNAPSEDPVSAARATQLTEILERQGQVLRNIGHADSFLSATDTAIGEISGLLTDAHNIALGMINGTTSHDERVAEGQLILGIIDQLATVGNRRYGDMFLFGGQQTRQVPFTQDHGVAEYRGDIGMLLSTVADGYQQQAVNLTGADLFGALSNQVRGTVDLNPALTLETRLADISGAVNRGVSRGSVRFTLSSPAISFTADLSQADTVGDVIDIVNGAAEAAGLTVGAGGQFNMSLNGTRDGFQIAAGGTVSVAEVGDGVTARDLGILGSGAAIAGTDLNAKVTHTTTLAALFGGAGAVLGSIAITNGHLNATVDFTGAETIQDVLNRINTAGVDVQAKINSSGYGIDVVNLVSGFQMRISETGDGTASLLGIRSYHAASLLSEMNQGRGVQFAAGVDDMTILAKNGTSFGVNLDGALTVQDVLDKINAAATAAGVAVTASLAASGNGIRIADATGGAGSLTISKANLSPAIDGLGLAKTTNGVEIVSDDTHGVVPDSVFTALHNLYEGLMHDDQALMQEASERIEWFIQQAARKQGEVGARSRAMTTRLQLTEDAVVSTQAMLSQVKDLDYSEAVTRFQQAQMTLQANLMTGSRMMQLSLLDFLG